MGVGLFMSGRIFLLPAWKPTEWLFPNLLVWPLAAKISHGVQLNQTAKVVYPQQTLLGWAGTH
jgi:hypothetical protein